MCLPPLCAAPGIAVSPQQWPISRPVFQNKTLPAGHRSLTLWLCSYFCPPQNGVHKQNGGSQWAACSEVQAIMRQMSGYWENHSRRGSRRGVEDTSLLLLPGFTLSLSLLSLLCLSWPLALSSSLANMWTCTRENTAHTHTHTHTHTHPTSIGFNYPTPNPPLH